MKKITPDKWVWMPHPAHFICAKDCNFRLATRIGKYIVSTVGEYFPDRVVREIHAQVHDPTWLMRNKHLRGDEFDYEYMKRFGYDDIGLNRKYETMVFRSARSKHKCCPWTIDSGQSVDELSYNKVEDAYAGHMRMCKKYSSQ